MLCISNNPIHPVCSRAVPIIKYIQITAIRHMDAHTKWDSQRL